MMLKPLSPLTMVAPYPQAHPLPAHYDPHGA